MLLEVVWNAQTDHKVTIVAHCQTLGGIKKLKTEKNSYFCVYSRFWTAFQDYWTDFKSFGCFENFGTFSETYADQIHATMDFEVRLSGKLIVAVVNSR